MNLRDYQKSASDAVMAEWEDKHSTLVVMPTGTGKTVLFADIIRRVQPNRVMVVAHREELLMQARDKISFWAGLECAIEIADQTAPTDVWFRKQVVVSTVQTQSSGRGDVKRMHRFKPEDFGCLIIDECFVPGTLVDGVPIERIRHGQSIRTHRGSGTVTHIFRHHATSLVRLTFSDGNQLVATPNHPIWSDGAFRNAIDLTFGAMVLTITPHEQMRHLRWGYEEQTLRSGCVPVGVLASDNPKDFQETRRRNNTAPQNQRDAQPSRAGAGIYQVAGDGLEAHNPAWQWNWSNNTATGIGGSFGLGYGSGDSHEATQRNWLSDVLQGGRWELGFESRGRRGWEFSPHFGSEISRPQEGGTFEFVGVVAREILKPGCGGEFERLCPGGVVYNLEVSNGNTYFANSILVHNCHHATAQSYKDLIAHYRQNPNLKVLGVTATPDRTDEEALGQVFDSVAFDYEILDAIQDGYLVPIYQHIVGVESLDFSHVRTTAGDLNGADLAEVMENEKNMQGIAGAAVQIIGDRRTIVFAASVKQAETLSEIFNRHKSGSAGWVCGQTNREERKELLANFATGKVQIVVNVGVLTEGFDNPGVETIVMARPTKSRSLYAQMAGRSTRPLPGVIDAFDTPLERRAAIANSAKPHCTIVDFVGNSGRHKLMTSADILGGNVSDEALERAVEKATQADGPVDMAALIQRSEEELKAEAARLKARRDADAARRAQLVAKVQYRSKVINPFDVWDIEPQTHTRGWDAGKQLTEKQGALLRKQGIDPDSMPYVQAKQVLNEMFRRWNQKLCTLKQANLLKKHGFPTTMTMREASATIDALAKAGWDRRNMIVDSAQAFAHSVER